MSAGGHVAVVVNPVATRVDGSLRERVVAAAGLSGAEVRERVTTGPGQAAGLAAGEVAAGARLVVAVGGDGHAADILGALVGSAVPVAIIPGGNANVIARALGWPARPAEASALLAASLADPRTRAARLGRVRADGVDRVFGLNAGIGLDASAVARVERRPALKHRLRHAAFALAAVASALELIRRPVDIEVRAGELRVAACSLIVACGSPYTWFAGRPLDLLPDADFDGRLAWLALQSTGIGSLLAMGAGVLARGRVPSSGTARGSAAEIAVTAEGALALHADGEALGAHRSFAFTTTDPVMVIDPRTVKFEVGAPI